MVVSGFFCSSNQIWIDRSQPVDILSPLKFHEMSGQCQGDVMRSGWFLLSAALVLGLLGDGGAQTQAPGSFFSTAPPESFFTGVNPATVKRVPVDINAAMKTLNINKAFASPQQPKTVDVSAAMKTLNINQAFVTHPPPRPFILSNYFPKITLPSWPPIIANTSKLPNSPFETITPVPPPKKK